MLPSTAYGTGSGGGGGLPLGGFGGGGGSLDGSGRSVKMDAPVVKAWKKASGYTKYSYYFLGFTCFLIFYGFRSLRYWNSSIWLTCHQQECTLEITPPGSRSHKVVFPRAQLHGAHAVKTDEYGNFIEIDKEKYQPPERKKKNKKYKQNKPNWSSKGPDAQGRYRTYRITFWKETPDGFDDVDFSSVKEYLTETDDGMHAIQLCHFGMSQTRMRIRSNVNKVDSYIKKRRQKLFVKESSTLPWFGILSLVFGLIGMLLTILIGQFANEEPKKQGGPGARRGIQKSSYHVNKNRRQMASKPKSPLDYRKKF